jgi:hypothetical protein
MCINNFYSPIDDGFLPTMLCVMGLAHQLNKAAKARVKSALPRVYRTARGFNKDDAYFTVPIQGSPQRAFRVDGACNAGGHDYQPPRRGNGAGGGQAYPPRDGTGGNRSFPPRSYPPNDRGGPSRPPSGADTSRGCFVNPGCNNRRWDPSLVCDACCRSGHLASQCNMLAMAIFIEKYKSGTSADEKDRIEAAWLEKHKVTLGNPSKNPRWVMKTYIDLLDTTMDEVDIGR